MNQLQAAAPNEGLRCVENTTGSNWSRYGWAPLGQPVTAPLLELLDRLNPTIAELSQVIKQEVEKEIPQRGD